MEKKFDVIEGNPIRNGGRYIERDSYGSGWGTLWTDGISTCLAVTLFDTKRQMGAMARIGGKKFEEVPKRLYPKNIVDTLLTEFSLSGSEECPELEATLVGESERTEGISDIVRESLLGLKIQIIGEDLGKVPIGREVYLHCNEKKVQVYRYTPSYNK
ncbi:MAG: hypothetical protein KKA62_04915 [Nanoarchaeota archaeon]|nr:hypothetical protein [Nanoarchaeota archaeon]MBU1644282.1 hypothetical protein [Nanoarchaeota archaeon]MBU1977262.1 hypothetical protein [Nanoarchaeota archaeon]